MTVLLAGWLLAAGPVATSDAPAGSITARAADGPVRVLPAKPDLPPGELLTVLPGTTVRAANGAVSVTCRADPNGRSPVPVLETAFTLGTAPNTDLEVTLDRGRIDLLNTKPDGPAVVAVKLHTFAWTVTLDRPGSRAAVELAGRRPPGQRFDPAGKPADPDLSAVVAVLAGSATVADGRTTTALSAPPGPGQLFWTSAAGPDPKVATLTRLPAWADPQLDNTPDAVNFRRAVEKLRAGRAKDPDAALDDLLKSRTPAEWRLGLVTAAATDDLLRLANTLGGATDTAVSDYGAAVLRHWLGRGPGQDGRLFTFLVGRGYDRPAAATVVDLLTGFAPTARNRPEVYDVLVEYLQHDKPAVRSLAAWHLVRMVPAGRTIPFRPNGSKQDAEAAYKQWRKLVPPGVLPAGRAKDLPDTF